MKIVYGLIIVRFRLLKNRNDEVWILGDIGFYRVDKIVRILNSLNGVKRLCLGNHDGHYMK